MSVPDPKDKISTHFVWKEALWLPSWSRMATEEDGVNQVILENSKHLFAQMDLVREFIGKPIKIHVAYRPLEYNKFIGGALRSAHSEGLACDFSVAGMTCDDVRKMIVEFAKLEQWNMRCEDKPASNWVHLDCRAPAQGGKRFFKP